MPAYASIRQEYASSRGTCGRCLLQKEREREDIRQHMPAYASIRQHTSAYVSTRQHMPAHVSIRQHTSAYVSIHQHTSAAYVSIRQHTSADVSRRQRCSERGTWVELAVRVIRARIRQHTSAAYVSSIRQQRTSAYVSSIRQHTSAAYVSIRQHTPAYVSIRQHTSAYVSTRQHTSAYVSGTWVELAVRVIRARILRDAAASVRFLGQRGAFRQVYLVIQTVRKVLLAIDAVAYPSKKKNTARSVSLACRGFN